MIAINLPPLWADTLEIAVGGAVLMGIVAVLAGVSTYIERKIAGHMQARVGPFRVGPHGTLQWVADALKLLTKEDTIPARADRLLFRLAPYVMLLGAFAAWVALPYVPPDVGRYLPSNLNIGILYLLSVSSAAVVAILMAGWASASKWALFGAMRSAAQIVSYEIPMGLTILAMLLVAGSLNLHEIIQAQATGTVFHLAGGEPLGVLSWYLFRHAPFTILAFLVYYTACLAETNRTPFDIPEAESELVAGYHTEYSGMRFSFFFLAEYANMFVVSAIAATLFLGGWLPPFPNLYSAGASVALFLAGLAAGKAALGTWYRAVITACAGALVGLLLGYFHPDRTIWIADYLGAPRLKVLEGLFWFASKSCALVLGMMWLRWTLPRYRVDQLMDLCWKKLLPLAFVCLGGIGLLEWLTHVTK